MNRLGPDIPPVFRIKLLTLQGQRLRCAEPERQLNEMDAELQKTNIEVDHELSNAFTSTTQLVHASQQCSYMGAWASRATVPLFNIYADMYKYQV